MRLRSAIAAVRTLIHPHFITRLTAMHGDYLLEEAEEIEEYTKKSKKEQVEHTKQQREHKKTIATNRYLYIHYIYMIFE